jgi:5-methyltetrahydrofolate--homocysteine methyltransferase
MKIQENRINETPIKKQTVDKNTDLLSLNQARSKKFISASEPLPKPKMLGIEDFSNFNLTELRDYIDWTPFFHGWGLKGKYPNIFEKDRVGPEAKRIYEEALSMLDTIIEKNLIQPKGVIGLFPANSEDDDILIFKNEQRKEIIAKIPMLRQQQRNKIETFSLSLSDFIAPLQSGIKDYFGGFAVTTGKKVDEYTQKLKSEGDSYNSIMFRLVADRLVEAAAEKMHECVRKTYWAYVPDEKLSVTERIAGKYKGIRPAIGYPICPDHSLKEDLFKLLEAEKRTGIELTETYAMKPASSVSGFYLAHDASKYFGIGKIGQDQLADYAKRSGKDLEVIEKLLHFIIN